MYRSTLQTQINSKDYFSERRKKKILNVFQRTLMILSSILYQRRKIIVKIIVKENVLGNMLNRVISKVLQLALDFCSIPGGTTAVKNLICKKIIYFEVSCCD